LELGVFCNDLMTESLMLALVHGTSAYGYERTDEPSWHQGRIINAMTIIALQWLRANLGHVRNEWGA